MSILSKDEIIETFSRNVENGVTYKYGLRNSLINELCTKYYDNEILFQVFFIDSKKEGEEFVYGSP